METEALRTRLNLALKTEDWKVRNEYKSVSVLVLYWQEGDMPGFKEEAHEIGEFFATHFHYDTEYYEIPSDHSHIRLDTKINSFLGDHGDPDHLMIIHYGGHGDPNDDEEKAERNLAVWAA